MACCVPTAGIGDVSADLDAAWAWKDTVANVLWAANSAKLLYELYFQDCCPAFLSCKWLDMPQKEATLDSLDVTYGQSITTVSIAHRLTSIVASDVIYVLKARVASAPEPL